MIWPSNIRNFDILKCLLYDSTFEIFSIALLTLFETLIFHGSYNVLMRMMIWPSNFRIFFILKFLLQGSSFVDAQWLCLRPETLISHCCKMFCEKLIWPSNNRNFDILKCLLYDSTFEIFNRLLASWTAYISRCYNVWLKVDLTVKYKKFCRFEMFVIRLKFVDAQSLSYGTKRLYFTVVKCLVKSWFDHQISDILKCLLFGSNFKMLNHLLALWNEFILRYLNVY